MLESTKALRKALKNKIQIEDQTIVRWTSAERYVYVAIFIASQDAWFTTGDNYFVEPRMEADEFLSMLSRSDVTDVEVAVSWEAV